ncbi:hypothetical protein HMPREF3190_00513 [Umbribacter vaginalis]|nr:hypothetical protein HMPREF3190_00513 [Coriobacteriales bacterium DNF00809]
MAKLLSILRIIQGQTMILKRVIPRFTIHVSDTLLSGSIHTT